MITLSLDAMGGDHGPLETVVGALDALRSTPDLTLELVGDPASINQILNQQSEAFPQERLSVVMAEGVVGMSESPVEALKDKPNSSIQVAVRRVSEGHSQGVVSSGNTGAGVAAATMAWRTLSKVQRPAIACFLPCIEGHFLMLDCGANVKNRPQHLYQYALMGTEYVKCLKNLNAPRVALLNIGSEEEKGNDLVKESHELLRQSAEINYQGFVEGNHLFEGQVDVVVCDGFLGNNVLKVLEGMGAAIFTMLKQELNSSPLTQIGGMMARNAFRQVKARMDHSEYGGAVLLGVNGVFIKSHGRSRAPAITNAIKVARQAVTNNVNQAIEDRLQNLKAMEAKG